MHASVVGGTGTGKTTTLETFGDGALRNGYTLLITDCKGGSLKAVARRLAERYGVPCYVVDPDDPLTLGYNICSGDAAAVANKLIGAFSFGPNAEIYKNIAMEVLPVVVRGLQATGSPVTLLTLYEALAPGCMENLASRIRQDDELHRRLIELGRSNGDRTSASGIGGLRHRLGALLEGKFGGLFRMTPALDLDAAFGHRGVIYVALSALASSEDVELMGRVLAQDYKQACYRRIRALEDGHHLRPVLSIWDEFAALREPEQLIDLLLQARQAAVPTIISSQFLPHSDELRKALLGSGLLVAHRVEGEDAEALANQFGTRRGGELTSQVPYRGGLPEMGTLRPGERYNVHPNELRTFKTGQIAIKSVTQGKYAIVRVYNDASSR
jgi:hypothetical protein